MFVYHRTKLYLQKMNPPTPKDDNAPTFEVQLSNEALDRIDFERVVQLNKNDESFFTTSFWSVEQSPMLKPPLVYS
jgi:hypothetical protein